MKAAGLVVLIVLLSVLSGTAMGGEGGLLDSPLPTPIPPDSPWAKEGEHEVGHGPQGDAWYWNYAIQLMPTPDLEEVDDDWVLGWTRSSADYIYLTDENWWGDYNLTTAANGPSVYSARAWYDTYPCDDDHAYILRVKHAIDTVVWDGEVTATLGTGLMHRADSTQQALLWLYREDDDTGGAWYEGTWSGTRVKEDLLTAGSTQGFIAVVVGGDVGVEAYYHYDDFYLYCLSQWRPRVFAAYIAND